MTVPPNHYPFSPYLASIDPLKIYPYAKTRLNPAYDFPHLRASDIERLVSFLENGGVVDPLNIVFWGEASHARIMETVDRLSTWVPTLLSAPQWGLASIGGIRVKLGTFHSLQHTRLPAGVLPLLRLTQVVGSWARHHIRIMAPLHVGGAWGTIALAGAHTEIVAPRRDFPFVWHRISDWERARDRLEADLRTILVTGAFSTRTFPTEGQWQGRQFDGKVVFVRVP